MRCLAADESRALLASTALTVGESGRAILAKAGDRIEARPHGDIASLGSFLDSIFRWLPPDASRVFFINDWGFGALAQPYAFVTAVRQAIGERRPLLEAPVHHFPAMSWTWDALEETEEQKRESGLLAGLAISVMTFGWDAWLAAEGCRDAVEFWEGNILFYSDDDQKLEDARAMLTGFGFPFKMK
jgi:hypothetical protein